MEPELITVYNQSTGTYEIVDKSQYFTNQHYYSENQRLDVEVLTSANLHAGYAEKEPEKKHVNGLGLYILVILCALSGITGTIWYRKKHKMKF